MNDDRQEAEFIANEIAQRQVTEHANWEDFAVLFRMNAQSRLIEQNLRQLRIPYRIVGGKSFFDRGEVKDVLAYASVLLNSDDDVSLLRVINSPPRGISDVTVECATELSARRKGSVFAVLRDEEFRRELASRALKAIDGFLDLHDRYETKLLQPLANEAEILRALLTEIGYVADLRRSCKTPEESLNREQNVHEILRGLEEYKGKSGGGLREYLDEMMLRQEREEDDDDMKGSGVTLITLHASKGLEFPHVYLIGLEEGVLPHDRSKLEGTVDEERRLLYVGITRAQRTLALTWCRSRMKYGSASPCHASSFIKELPPEWVEHQLATQILDTPVQQESATSRFASMRAMLDAS